MGGGWAGGCVGLLVWVRVIEKEKEIERKKKSSGRGDVMFWNKWMESFKIQMQYLFQGKIL